MAKTSRPDRHNKRDGRRREPSEFSEETLALDRVTRVVKGGRRMRFRATVIVGNKKGKVGMGMGKANEVQIAVQKASKAAKRHMIRVPIVKGTIPHAVDVKFKAAKIRLMPAVAGTGIIAGGALRVILEHAGVRDVLSKRFGTGNKIVNAQATFKALKSLRIPKGGFPEDKPAAVASDMILPPDKTVEVKTMSRKDAEAHNKAAKQAGQETVE